MTLAPDTAAALAQTQQFLLHHVYTTGPSGERDQLARRMVRDLFEAFLAEADRLPPRYRRRIEEQGLPRVACDYIAGMTDRYCRAEHQKLCGG